MEEEKNVFSTELLSALEIAKKIAKANLNKYYSAPHLLKAILTRDLSLLKRLENMNKDVYYLDEWAEVRIEEEPKTTNVLDAEPSDLIDEIIKSSVPTEFHEYLINISGLGYLIQALYNTPVEYRTQAINKNIESTQNALRFITNTDDKKYVEIKSFLLSSLCI